MALLGAAHVALALVAVGTNVAYPIVVLAAERGALPLMPALRAVRLADRWVTIPAYVLTALSGIVLTALDRIPFSALWIWLSIVLFVAFMGVGFAFYRRVSRDRLRASARGAADPAYARLRPAAAALDAFIVLSALAITALMVLRPA